MGVNITVVVYGPAEEGIVVSVTEKVPDTLPFPPVKIADLLDPPYSRVAVGDSVMVGVALVTVIVMLAVVAK